jgi:SOS-response transcriptional repressor LexA
MNPGATIRQRRKSLGLTQDVVAAQARISKPYLSNIETGRAKNPPTDAVLMRLEIVLKFQEGELIGQAHLARTPPDVRRSHEQLKAEVQELRAVLSKLSAAPHTEGVELNLERIKGKLGLNRGDFPPADNVRSADIGKRIPIINRVSAGYPQDFTDLDYPPSVADEYVQCPNMNDPQAFAARVVGDSMEPDYHEDDVVIFSPNTLPRNGDDCFVRFDGDYSTTFKRFYLDSQESIRLQPRNNKYPSQVYAPAQITGLWPAVFRFEKVRR